MGKIGMPYGKRYAKKTTKSRARNRRRRKAYPRIPLGIESSRIVKLRYCDNFTLDPGVGTISTYTISANGLFDPNISGTGHQPMYFDTYSNIYDHYVVLGSKITVHASPVTASAGTAVVFGVLIEDGNTTLTANPTSYMMEQKNSSYKLTNSVNYSAPGNVTLTKNFSAKKFFGCKDLKDNIDNFGAAVNANPQDQAYFRIWCGGQNITINPAQYQFTIKAEYIVMFSELKEQSQS